MSVPAPDRTGRRGRRAAPRRRGRTASPAGAPGTAGRPSPSGCCSSRSPSSRGGAAGTRMLTDADTGAGESGRADRVIEQAGYPADTHRARPDAGSGRPALAPADVRVSRASCATRLSRDCPQVASGR